jgi:hypothetical protein
MEMARLKVAFLRYRKAAMPKWELNIFDNRGRIGEGL